MGTDTGSDVGFLVFNCVVLSGGDGVVVAPRGDSDPPGVVDAPGDAVEDCRANVILGVDWASKRDSGWSAPGGSGT